MDMLEDSWDEDEEKMISGFSGATKLKDMQSPTPTKSDTKEPIFYDYMKYANKKKKDKGLHGHGKERKCVSFKRVVELVSFTEDWKMLRSESHLRTEEGQRKCTNMKSSF